MNLNELLKTGNLPNKRTPLARKRGRSTIADSKMDEHECSSNDEPKNKEMKLNLGSSVHIKTEPPCSYENTLQTNEGDSIHIQVERPNEGDNIRIKVEPNEDVNQAIEGDRIQIKVEHPNADVIQLKVKEEGGVSIKKEVVNEDDVQANEGDRIHIKVEHPDEDVIQANDRGSLKIKVEDLTEHDIEVKEEIIDNNPGISSASHAVSNLSGDVSFCGQSSKSRSKADQNFNIRTDSPASPALIAEGKYLNENLNMLCKGCGYSFSDILALIKHEMTCYYQANDKPVDSSSITINGIDKNAVIEIDDDRVCEKCGEKHEGACKPNDQTASSSVNINGQDKNESVEIVVDHVCEKCETKLPDISALKKHKETCKISNENTCTSCEKSFQGTTQLKRHLEKCSPDMPQTSCIICIRHINHHSDSKRPPLEPTKLDLLQRVFNESHIVEYKTASTACFKYYFLRCLDDRNLKSFFIDKRIKIQELIHCGIVDNGLLKVNMWADVIFIGPSGETVDEAFKTKIRKINKKTNIAEFITSQFNRLNNELQEFLQKMNGWSLLCVDGLRLRLRTTSALEGGYIKLPRVIENKRACINVKNKDNKCFMYAVLGKHVTNRLPQSPSSYYCLLNKYDFSCISYPTPLSDIPTFESKNNMSINVYGLDEKFDVCPLRLSPEHKPDHTDLLLLKTLNGKFHYVYIASFDRLMRKQSTGHKWNVMVCKICFRYFRNLKHRHAEESLKKHMEKCAKSKKHKLEKELQKTDLKKLC